MYPKKPPFHSNPIPIQKEKQDLGFVKKDEKRMRNEAKEGAKKVREPFFPESPV